MPPFNGSGTYSPPANSFNPAVAATTINATDFNSLLADITTALSTCVLKDGTQTTTAAVPFSQGITLGTVAKFTSTGQTITAAGSLTLAHGLASTPSLHEMRLKCTSTDNGYSVNDEILYPFGSDNSAASDRGIAVWPDATNLNIRFGAGSPFNYPNKTTGVTSALDPTKWTAIFRAWVI